MEKYPDTTVSVTGRSFLDCSFKGKLRRNSYEAYLAALAKRYHLEDKLLFLGDLNARQMKQAFLDANVFVLSSAMENSPNALGEAMVLGLPCIASDVGGVRDMLDGEKEGYVFDSGDVDVLAEHIMAVFAMEEKAAEMGLEARNHALRTHAPEKNLRDLMKIYERLM